MPYGILRRFLRTPHLFLEILFTSLLIALLGLAYPLFSIQVFNRYLAHGHDGTLISLASGVLIALFFLHGLFLVRSRMLAAVSDGYNRDNADALVASLTRVRLQALFSHQQNPAEIAAAAQARTETAASPTTLAAIFDFPFSLFYIAAVFLLNPLIGWICLGFVIAGFCFGLWDSHRISGAGNSHSPVDAARRRILSEGITAAETLRLSNGADFLKKRWSKLDNRHREHHRFLVGLRDRVRAKQNSLAMGLYIAVYTFGGILVVEGRLSVGAIIGASILSSRAFRNTSQFASSCYFLMQAKSAQENLDALRRLPMEPVTGTAIHSFTGRLGCRDLTFIYPGAAAPLFEKLTVEISPGSLVLVWGKNGSGKTTLARLLAGLLTPRQGEILVDGVSLSQVALPWWRQQLICLPQEPVLIDGTIRENILLGRPDLTEEDLNRTVVAADLRPFLDRASDGIATRVRDGGRNLAAGIRKRIALARALAVGGRLALFDEPFENIDQDGRRAIEKIIRDLLAAGSAVVLFVSNPRGIHGADLALDLNDKPTPRLFRTGADGSFFRRED